MSKTCSAKICEVGGKGNLLPAFGDNEQEWPRALRVVLYAIGLAWTFMGVAIVADVFMGAIECITSKKRRVVDENGRSLTVKVWNDTVANLTLMALGSSAPEILLSIIELVFTGKMHSGDLGPSTIVGSAAFNLLCISAVCILAIPETETRKIKDTQVFIVTASCSVFAYLWLYFIVMLSSENVIDLWEAILTFLMFPALVFFAYQADCGLFSSQSTRDDATHERVALAEVSKDELAEIGVMIMAKHGQDLSDDEVARLIEQEHAGPKSRAQYRVAATRNMTGGKKVESAQKPQATNPSHSANAVVPITEVDLKVDDVTIDFAATSYAVLESVGTMTITVRRVGCLEQKAMVDYKTRDGTAKAHSDYEPLSGTLEFLNNEETKTIAIVIIDDTAYEEDEEFFVDLSNARCADLNYSAVLGRNNSATIAIVDDDEPGIIVFEAENSVMKVTENPVDKKLVPINVRRKEGSNGKIACKYATENASAIAGVDYQEAEGTLEFDDGQTNGHIDLTILPRGRYDKTEEFRIILSEPTGGARFDPKSDGKDESEILTILIEADEKDKGRVDNVLKVLNMDWEKSKIGHGSWKEQFQDAIYVNGGEEDGEVGVKDWVLHIITIFWKVLFACIPPTDFCNGWACFYCALGMIGAVTAIIGDMAALLGCVLSLPDSVTAITFVALGTSLPDTFASQTAAQQDPYADASIGNITGSNSVNVFLGLGLPYITGAIYWLTQERSSDWAGRYPEVLKGMDPNKKDTKFVVMGGDLGFSLVVFIIVALLCIALLVFRRFRGGELGGANRWLHAGILVFMWFLYIALSSWKAMSKDDPCK